MNRVRILWHWSNHFLKGRVLGNPIEVYVIAWGAWEKNFILQKNAENEVTAKKITKKN